MKKKLTSAKNYEPACKNCAGGRLSPDKTVILCKKKGITDPDFKCRAFKYDPLKRCPRKAPELITADPSEFEL